MAWSQNPTPGYSVGPYAPIPVLLPTTAKTAMGDNTNAVKVIDHSVAALANYRILLSQIDLVPTGALSAGKFWLFLAAIGATTTGFLEKDELVNASQSGFSTTVGGTRLNFPTWTSSKPLIVPEGYDLWAASSVAQASPPYLDMVGKLY
jgi:hypothetical protein